ncbi:hypothetical protein E4U58_000369 [Claviceps cyperi]|nr:hypothetical protein E4U58_000369 [Claviceps cyperi]
MMAGRLAKKKKSADAKSLLRIARYAHCNTNIHESRETSFTRLRWQRRHRELGTSDDLRTPVNATQGAQDALVSDSYQFNFDDFLGLRSPDLMHHDAAQHGSSKSPTPAAPVSTLPDSPHFQFSGSKPVAVDQDADRLTSELDRDRAVKMRLFRDMCAAFDQVAADYASGPGRTLAQEFKQFYMGFWTAALKVESPPSPSRAAAPKPAAKPTTYASVASREGPTAYTLKTQCKTSRAAQRATAPPAEDLRLLVRLELKAPTWDTDAYAIRRAVANRSDIPFHRVPAATRTKTG